METNATNGDERDEWRDERDEWRRTRRMETNATTIVFILEQNTCGGLCFAFYIKHLWLGFMGFINKLTYFFGGGGGGGAFINKLVEAYIYFIYIS